MSNAVGIKSAGQYQWGDGCDGWHLVQRDDMSVIQEQVPPGKSERNHVHRHSRQFFYILEGTATMEADGTTVTLHQHEGIEIAPTVPHRLRNDSDANLVFLVISVPRSHGDRVDL